MSRMASASVTATALRRGRTARREDRVARFVTTGAAAAEDVELLVDACLASVARRRLAGTDLAEDPRLVRAAVAGRARHAAVRAQVVPLLRAWSEAGAELLLFKGSTWPSWCTRSRPTVPTRTSTCW